MSSADIFSNLDFEIFFTKTIRVQNKLDPDQGSTFYRPDLGPNRLHRLSSAQVALVGKELTTKKPVPSKEKLQKNISITTEKEPARKRQF